MKSWTMPGRGGRIHVLVLDQGEEVISTLQAHLERAALGAAHFTAIGAFSEISLGFFDRRRRQYQEIEIPEQVEVLALTGNVALADGLPRLHAHVVVGRRDGSAHGGHLLRGRVSPTLELIVEEMAGALVRRFDAQTGLPLIAGAADAFPAPGLTNQIEED